MSRQTKQKFAKFGDDGQQVAAQYAARLKAALEAKGVTPAWLAKKAGIPDRSVRNQLEGTEPKIVSAIALASALEVNLAWLLTGAGQMTAPEPPPRSSGSGLFDASEADWVFLPHYAFESAIASMSNTLTHTYPVPRHLLNNQLGTARNLWVTNMPTDELPSVATKGEPIICRNALILEPGKVYVLSLDGNLVVRRLTLRGFSTDDEHAPALSLQEAQLRDSFPVGEVLARFGLSPVASRL